MLGTWGTHDPFMANALRAGLADAKHAQVRAHDDVLATVEARRQLRMATTAKGLHKSLHRVSEARLAQEPEVNPLALSPDELYESRAAAVARATFGKPPDPLEGTLNRAEFEASLPVGDAEPSRSAPPSPSPSGAHPQRAEQGMLFSTSRRSLAGGATLRSSSTRDLLAPADGRRVDIDKFCTALGEPVWAHARAALAGERAPREPSAPIVDRLRSARSWYRHGG
jgi:hypothetical protein